MSQTTPTNIVTCSFNGRTVAWASRELFQWDRGQVLQFPDLDLPAAYQVHFANSPLAADAPTQTGTAEGVSIPDTLLETGLPVFAWLVLQAGEGDRETVKLCQIVVIRRPPPSGVTPTPAQQSALDEAIDLINEAAEDLAEAEQGIPTAIDTALAEAKESGEFDGPPGQDGTDGTDGAQIWYTGKVFRSSSQSGYVYATSLTYLTGKNVDPAVNDYVFGPESGSGDPENLYVIESISAGRANLMKLGSIIGPAGQDGTDGEDGYSPSASVSKSGSTATITITDSTGTTSATVSDGQDGQDGTDGAPGTKIWYTSYQISTVSGSDYIPRSKLSGQTGTPAVGDYVFGPEAGAGAGDPTDLYEIAISAATCTLKWVCRVKGADGSGGGIAWMTYGTSTDAEIQAALDAGKIPAVAYSDSKYIYSTYSSSQGYIFTNVYLGGSKRVSCKNNTWDTGSLAYPSAATATPSNLGTAAVGSSSKYAREDHVHNMPSASDVGAYALPSGGIPSTDLSSAVQTSLGKADTAYQKPSGGIPKTDLASAVQTSLGKADTALQEHQSLAAYRTSAAQDTIDAGKADKITEVTNSSAGDVTATLDPGKIYHFTGAISSLTLTLGTPASGQLAQYHFDFDSGSTAATISISGVSWPGGSFTPEASTHYEVDILNGYGLYIGWEVTP